MEVVKVQSELRSALYLGIAVGVLVTLIHPLLGVIIFGLIIVLYVQETRRR